MSFFKPVNKVSALAMCMIAVLSLSALSAISWAKMPPSKALEVLGPTYPIAEENAIETIKKNLAAQAASGELAKKQEQAKKAIIDKSLNLPPVEGLSLAEKNEVRYFDPSIQVAEDIRTPDGVLIAAKGEVRNPLDVMPLTKKLFFFDGRDRDQVALAKRLAATYKLDFLPILTAGSWADLSKEMNTAVYFDQMGKMSQRYGLTQIPVLLQQENKLIRIETLVAK